MNDPKIFQNYKLTWIEDNNRFKTRQFRLIYFKSFYLQTQLGHNAIEYLHNAGLHRHVAAKCIVGTETHLLGLNCASLEGAIRIPPIILDVLIIISESITSFN